MVSTISNSFRDDFIHDNAKANGMEVFWVLWKKKFGNEIKVWFIFDGISLEFSTDRVASITSGPTIFQ